MKTTATAICLILTLFVFHVFSADAESLASQRLAALYKAGITDEAFDAFVAGLSRQDLISLLQDLSRQGETSEQGRFEFMSLLARVYYSKGAGKNDGLPQWTNDIQDKSLPVEWRQLVAGRPPFKLDSLSADQLAEYTNVLRTLAFSKAEPPGLRRQALLGLRGAMNLQEYALMLGNAAKSEGEDPHFRREALLQMGRVVYRGKLEGDQTPEFKEAADDYESLLSDLEARTNLPPALDEGVKLLKRQKRPYGAKGDAGSH